MVANDVQQGHKQDENFQGHKSCLKPPLLATSELHLIVDASNYTMDPSSDLVSRSDTPARKDASPADIFTPSPRFYTEARFYTPRNFGINAGLIDSSLTDAGAGSIHGDNTASRHAAPTSSSGGKSGQDLFQ